MSPIQLSLETTNLDQIQNFFLNSGLEKQGKSRQFRQGQTQRNSQRALSHFICTEFCLLMTSLNVNYIVAITNIFNLALQAVALY